MSNKKKLGLSAAISATPFLVMVIIVEIITQAVSGKGRPFDNDLSIASILLPLVAVCMFIENKVVQKILAYVGLAISLFFGLILSAGNAGYEPNFIQYLWMVALCFQFITYGFCVKFLGKNDIVDICMPLIHFAILTVIGIPFAALGVKVAKFFGRWFVWILAMVAVVAYLYYKYKNRGMKPKTKSSTNGSRGGPSPSNPQRMRHLREPSEDHSDSPKVYKHLKEPGSDDGGSDSGGHSSNEIW